MQVREKVEKVAKHCVLPMFCGPEAQKVGSQKRRVWSHLGRCEMKNCRPLWHEAHFLVKMNKTPHVRNTFGGSDVEKVHAVVARSTLRSENAKSTTRRFWTFRCRKKCKLSWREAHSEVKSVKKLAVSGSDAVSRGRRNGFCNLPQVSQTCGFCSSCKNDGKCGTFEEDLHRWISCGRRVTRDMFIRDVRRSGHFPEKCCILEHQTFRFAKMILRDGRSTSYDLASRVKLKN